jgi:hypothetical protein
MNGRTLDGVRLTGAAKIGTEDWWLIFTRAKQSLHAGIFRLTITPGAGAIFNFSRGQAGSSHFFNICALAGPLPATTLECCDLMAQRLDTDALHQK